MNRTSTGIKRAGKALALFVGAVALTAMLTGCPPPDEPEPAEPLPPASPPAPDEEPVETP